MKQLFVLSLFLVAGFSFADETRIDSVELRLPPCDQQDCGNVITAYRTLPRLENFTGLSFKAKANGESAVIEILMDGRLLGTSLKLTDEQQDFQIPGYRWGNVLTFRLVSGQGAYIKNIRMKKNKDVKYGPKKQKIDRCISVTEQDHCVPNLYVNVPIRGQLLYVDICMEDFPLTSNPVKDVTFVQAPGTFRVYSEGMEATPSIVAKPEQRIYRVYFGREVGQLSFIPEGFGNTKIRYIEYFYALK